MPLEVFQCKVCNAQGDGIAGLDRVQHPACGCETLELLKCPQCAKAATPCTCHENGLMIAFCHKCTNPHIYKKGEWQLPNMGELMYIISIPEMRPLIEEQVRKNAELRRRTDAAAQNN